MTQQFHFTQKRTLLARSAVDQAPGVPVSGTLLCSTKPVLCFVEGQTSFGEDDVQVFAAFHNGEQCWLRRATWVPSSGYSAEGVEECILPFDEGVRLFLEQGVFALDEVQHG